MKLYRGVSQKKCKLYKEKGIPKNTNFVNTKKDASRFGECVIEVTKTKNIQPDKQQNKVFKKFNISERYYKNKKTIKRFKIK